MQQNNQQPRFYAKENHFRPNSIENRERAHTGVHKYHPSPIGKKIGQPNQYQSKDPIVVYFTTSSPQKPMIQQIPEKPFLSPQPSNYYGIINSRISKHFETKP